MLRALALGVLSSLLLPFTAIAGELQAKLDERLAEVRIENSLVGVGGAIAIDGDIVALSVDGNRHKNGAPIAPNDKWHLGSVTKSMTSIVIGMLVDDGLITYDDTLLDLLPGIEMHPGWQAVTLH